MAPHPQVAQLLSMIETTGGPALHEQEPPAARESYKSLNELTPPQDEPASSEDRTIPGPAGDIPVRIHRPAGDGPHGVLVYFHGGGWVIGDIETHETITRALCVRAGIAVVSVDYRLAPEHPFPAAADDALATTAWVADHAADLGVDPSRLAVGGDSAGGNLAAVVAQHAAKTGQALAFQLLVYPATDLTMSSQSYVDNAEGYFLTAAGMRWFIGHYLGGQDATDPKASPLYADDVSGVAPALVITAEYDPLRDEGNAYADKLRDAGVDVEAVCFDGQIHGFLGLLGILDDTAKALDLAAERLSAALS